MFSFLQVTWTVQSQALVGHLLKIQISYLTDKNQRTLMFCLLGAYFYFKFDVVQFILKLTEPLICVCLFSFNLGLSPLSTQHVPTCCRSVQSSAQLLRNVVKRISSRTTTFAVETRVMTSLPGSSLEPKEDRFSIVLSRLERIEASLSGLEDVKKLLEEIEDNTHADDDNKCDFRHNMEKVGVEVHR